MIRNSISRKFEIVDFDSLISIAPKKWEEAIFLIVLLDLYSLCLNLVLQF